MPPKKKINVLSDRTVGRLNSSLGFTEGFIHEQSDGRPSPANTAAPPGRVKLKTPLSYGTMGVGYRMELMNVDDKWRWVATSQEVPVFAVGGQLNYYGEGAELPVTVTPAGCVVNGDVLSVRMPTDGDEKFSPFSVLETGGVASDASDWSGTLYTYRPGDSRLGSFADYWRRPHVALTGYVPENRKEDEVVDPDNPKRTGVVVPAVPLGGATPVCCAFEPFNGKTLDGQDIPQPLYQAMGGGDSRPIMGQLWGPGSTGKMTRPFVAMELYWWEWKGPAFTKKTFDVQEPNEDYDPTEYAHGGICNPLKVDPDNGNVFIPNPDYDPRNTVCLTSVTVGKEYWATPNECGSSVSTGIETTEDPPERRSAFWISNKGWWGNGRFGAWNWNWFNGNWAYGPGSGWSPFGYGGYWGPWGYGWWGTAYGDFPPTQEQLEQDFPEDQPEPSPPCGEVKRRHLYGYVLWEWGYNALGSVGPADDNLCMVSGPIKSRSRLVVVDGTPPEPSPDE